MSTDKRTVDWYNKNAQIYAQHLKTDKGWHHFGLEKPAMYAELPDIGGKSVISVGSGPGEDSAELKRRGADRSLGIDISKEMVRVAQTAHPECEFQVMDMEKLSFADNEFDFAYCSLAIHYLEDWSQFLAEVFRIIKPGSYFLCSIGHPVTGSWDVHDQGDLRIKQVRVEENRKTNKVKVLGEYLDNIKHVGDDSHAMGVTVYQRSIASGVNAFIDARFIIKKFVEPKPLESQAKVNPADYQIFSKLPFVYILKAQKPE